MEKGQCVLSKIRVTHVDTMAETFISSMGKKFYKPQTDPKKK